MYINWTKIDLRRELIKSDANIHANPTASQLIDSDLFDVNSYRINVLIDDVVQARDA
jgi:hypothetical protein